jgi:hypothetical protein
LRIEAADAAARLLWQIGPVAAALIAAVVAHPKRLVGEDNTGRA